MNSVIWDHRYQIKEVVPKKSRSGSLSHGHVIAVTAKIKETGKWKSVKLLHTNDANESTTVYMFY